MAARARLLAIVALAAVAAAAATVGVTLLQTRGETTAAAASGTVTKPRPGSPPLQLDFGLRTDAEARALARAATLYNRGEHAQAAKVFARYGSLPALVGAAFARWPGHGLDDLKRLVASHPHSSLAELHLGLAYYWSGRNADAAKAFARAETLQPDTPYALSAATILHPSMPPQPLPVFVPSTPPPRAIANLTGRAQVPALARLARGNDVAARIYYGIALENLGRAVSAERAFAAAAKIAPNDPEALAAAAVGRFRKAHPERAFSRLGPLSTRFPHAAVVRFHLGFLLIWLGDYAQARTELERAIADGPQTVYAKDARLLLVKLPKNGTR
jgi:tetratricopeptide (TPR) repeat protein